MNTRLRDGTSLCSAVAMGLAVSTGYPLGIIAAAGMPLACLIPSTRKVAFQSTLGYYIAGLWPMIPGFERYFGNVPVPIAIWMLTAILLSLPWTIAWTSNRSHLVWRAPLALLATIVPPLGIIGLISPLTSAGYLFPGTAWVGVAAVALFPGIVLATHQRRTVLYLAAAVCAGLALYGRLLARNNYEAPTGWVAVNTHLGDVSQPFRDFAAAELIQQKAAESSARVLIFPEDVVPRWSEATEAFWRLSLNRCRTRGQILVIGAGLPEPRTDNSGREALNELRSYDFAAAITSLTAAETRPPARGVYPTNHARERIDNAVLVAGAESAIFYQRIPVPIGMWRPFSHTSVPLRLTAPGVLAIDHQRAAVLICYEQMLTFPVIASMLQHPTVIVGISNTFWIDGTTIPRYQANALRGWARLFRLPCLLAVNS